MTGHRRDRTANHNLNILTAANLSAARMLDTQIADCMGVNKSTVSHWLRRARELGWLSLPQLIESAVPADLLSKLGNHVLARSLLERIQRLNPRTTVREVRVFLSGGEPDPTNPDQWEAQLETFGLLAAQHLWRLIRETNPGVIGVSWGLTVGHVVRALESLDPRDFPPGNRNGVCDDPIQFMPIAGEWYGKNSAMHSASNHAARLSIRINGDEMGAASLAGVPAVLPYSFAKENRRLVAEQLFQRCDGYRRIFFEPKPLIDDLDTIFTSIGLPDEPLRPFAKELEDNAGVSRKPLRDLVVGDVGGILIARDDLDGDDVNTLNDIRSLWMGVKDKHFETIAQQHGPKSSAKAGGAGVVLIGIGANKALVVKAALPLTNRLVIDDKLGRALLHLLTNDQTT
jgi:hypothetical protein